MSTFVTVIHVIVSLILMLTVLLQSGKGGMGAAFGGGGGNTGTVFGGSGAGGFLRKLTVAAAVIFMLSSMTLAYIASASGEDALRSYSASQEQEMRMRDDASEKAKANAAGATDGEEGDAEDVTIPDELNRDILDGDQEGLVPEGDEADTEGDGATDTDTNETGAAAPPKKKAEPKKTEAEPTTEAEPAAGDGANAPEPADDTATP